MRFGRSRSPPARSPPRYQQSSFPECRLFVGNLPYEARSRDLEDLMRRCGPVIHCEVAKSANGASKGFGVVEFRFPEDARAAIREFAEYRFMGRSIFLREDRDYHDRPARRRQDRGNERVPEGCPLFVGNLPFSTSWQDLKDLFRETGNVLRADIILNHDGRSKGCGTVVMETREQADNAIRMFDRYEFGGRALEVRDDKFSGGKRPPPPPPPGPRHRELQPGSYERERSPVPPIYPRAADYSGRNGDVNMDLLSPLGPPTRSRSRSRTRSPPLPRSHQQQRHHFEPEYGDQWM